MLSQFLGVQLVESSVHLSLEELIRWALEPRVGNLLFEIGDHELALGSFSFGRLGAYASIRVLNAEFKIGVCVLVTEAIEESATDL